ncbi:MAG: metallophosphoesterase [Candidatus Heimdallarchaeum endolithica]|uniref:Metallophosphoesterase n=1 Tax=Candidatus Heimdallarchaeum endolithica TaxID=2876572 RepID=A0A9Y1BPY8_9ARCH|nr:MAG: metallophosphoesterase [Candidatus Heimdallarchaeum endolithica]
MKAIVLADIHGSLKLLRKLKKKLEEVDVIFVAGDIAGTIYIPLIFQSIIKYKKISREKYMELVFGKKYSEFVEFQLRSTKKILDFFRALNKPIFFTHGNTDTPEVITYIKQQTKESSNLIFIESKIVEHENLLVLGYGYCQKAEYSSIQTPTVREISTIRKDLLELKEQALFLKEKNKRKLFIGLFHEPPKNTHVDLIPMRNYHAGNKEIASLIFETSLFDFVFCGHVHEVSTIQIEKSTILINPGPLVNGYFAYVNLFTKKATLCRKRVLSISNIIYKLRSLFL